MASKFTWDAYYEVKYTPWDAGQPDNELAYFIHKYRVQHKTALDIGCGSGHDSIWLSKAGFDVTGIDISETAIKIATDLASKNHADVKFIAGDFIDDPLNIGTFDIIYDRAVLNILPNDDIKRQYIRRIHQHCKQDALWINIVISSTHIEELSKDVEFSTEFSMSLSQLTGLVEPLFDILEVRRTNFPFTDRNNKVTHFLSWATVLKPIIR